MSDRERSGPERAFAPAKINLYLHVVGRRPDGYHLLDSLVVFAGVGDTIEAVADDDGLQLTVDGPFAGEVPDDDGNLVLQAARGLAELAAIRPSGHLRLTKSLPVASGVGGGSSDAAAAIAVLLRLWRIGSVVPPERLMDLALRLGADVPMCVAGRPALVSGIGEVLKPAPVLPPAWLVLANPRAALPTPQVFRARQGPFSPANPLSDAPANVAAFAGALAARGNDLTDAAVGLCPVVAVVLQQLADLPGALLVRMSGSGATCFALFADASAAAAGAACLAARNPEWWCVAAPVAGSGLSD
jgi:4-diphosphocytidyl-2-C-methyl-D-erythritol kinase